MTDRSAASDRTPFEDLYDRLLATPIWLRETALDLEAGRISLDQAKAIAGRRGLQIVEGIYGPNPPPRKDRAMTAAIVPSAPAHVLDPLTAWLALPPDVQQLIGATAIAITVGALGVDLAVERGDPAAHRSRYAASEEAQSLLRALVAINVLDGDDTVLPPRPDLRPLGIRQCRECGCTDDFACDGGCSWVETDLCSVCVSEPAQ